MTKNELLELRAKVATIRPMLMSTTDWAALCESTQREYQQKHVALMGRLPMDAAKCKRSYYGKRAVGRLPKQWKTTLLGAVPKSSKYRAHVVAMAVCGCRPAEFENGVLV